MFRHLIFVVSGTLALAMTGPAVAESQFMKQFKRDMQVAKRDFRRKMGITLRVAPAPEAQSRRKTSRGPVIRRETGLVESSLRPAPRPGETSEVETERAVATGLPDSRAGRHLDMLLKAAVATGEMRPEVAQVIRAGSFPTMEELEARAAGLGNGWLPGGAVMALEGAKVVCEDGGAGGCARIAEDASLADVRDEIAVLEAQAASVAAVEALPGMSEAIAEVAAERASEDAPRNYPVARGEELPSIDSLLEARDD